MNALIPEIRGTWLARWVSSSPLPLGIPCEAASLVEEDWIPTWTRASCWPGRWAAQSARISKADLEECLNIWSSTWPGSLGHHPVVHVTGSENYTQCGEIFTHKSVSGPSKGQPCCLRIFLKRPICFCPKWNPGTPASFLSHFMVLLMLEVLYFVSLRPNYVFCRQGDLCGALFPLPQVSTSVETAIQKEPGLAVPFRTLIMS